MGAPEVVRWFATATGVCAAILIACDFGRRATGAAFVVFTFSSVAWIIAGYFENLTSLIVQNAVLTGVNVFGAYRWLARPDMLAASKGARP